MDFMHTVLDKLKERYIATLGERMFEVDSPASNKRYYLRELADNLIAEMAEAHVSQFGEGAGNELDSKMRAIHSSSALTYNLFGNEHVEFNEGCFGHTAFAIEYERKLQTLICSPAPAHLDVALTSDDGTEMLFCEMKMTEWFRDEPSRLRPAYFREARYVHSDSFSAFQAMISDLVDTDDVNDHGYACRLVVYDAFQMVKHMLGIYNFIHTLEHKPAKVTLVNGLWKIEHASVLGDWADVYQGKEVTSAAEFDVFNESAAPVKALFSGMGVEFEIAYMSVQQLLRCTIKTDEERKFLARYSL